jgi:hypothetical protein
MLRRERAVSPSTGTVTMVLVHDQTFKARCSPNRMSSIAAAILTLERHR